MDPFGGFGMMFALVSGFAILFIVLVFGLIVFAIVKGARKSAANNAAPEVSAVATVVDKRIETTGGGDMSVTQHHVVTFEQPGGERFELEAPAAEFGLLVVGDRGSVTMKGTQYLAFARELMR
jgi:outer membrane lipoprotein-sorting protein